MPAEERRRVYLDHHAATPLCTQAKDRMAAWMDRLWANPSSVHRAGQEVRAQVDRARREVGTGLCVDPEDVVFTSGGTEACNLGVAALAASVPRVLTTGWEHPAVLQAVLRLRELGKEVHVLSRPWHMGGLEDLQTWASQGRGLVATQWVNHELGCVWPVLEVRSVVTSTGGMLFLDATQALGKIPLTGEWTPEGLSDGFAVAAHKMGGPPGAGALWIRRSGWPRDGATRTLAPQLVGGEQERGRRAGSPDPLALTGFGAACLALDQRLESMGKIGALRDRLEAHMRERWGWRVNDGPGQRVATATNMSGPVPASGGSSGNVGWEGHTLVTALDLEGICVSSGAACSSGVQEPSAVVEGLYPGTGRSRTSLRFTLGPENTGEDISQAVHVLDRVLQRVV